MNIQIGRRAEALGKNFSEAAAEPKVLVDLEKGKISEGEQVNSCQ